LNFYLGEDVVYVFAYPQTIYGALSIIGGFLSILGIIATIIGKVHEKMYMKDMRERIIKQKKSGLFILS
jgi:hypothetical protein